MKTVTRKCIKCGKRFECPYDKVMEILTCSECSVKKTRFRKPKVSKPKPKSKKKKEVDPLSDKDER